MGLLDHLPVDDAQRVLSCARRRRFDRREVIFREGDVADSLYLVTHGRIAVRVTSALGDTATLDIVGTGGVVGEQALLPPKPTRSAAAVALDRTEAMQLGEADFAALRREHPSVDAFLLGLLATRNLAVTARLTEALYVPTETRVLRRLVDLANRFGNTESGAIVVAFTQEDLAGLAGTTRESVNRVLHSEAEQGSVALGRAASRYWTSRRWPSGRTSTSTTRAPMGDQPEML